jgi:phosphatidylinositol alpha-1,6-mannosyltransferase
LRALLLTPDFPPAHGGIQQWGIRLAEHLEAKTRVVTLAGAAGRDGSPGVRRVRSMRHSGPAAVAALNAAALHDGLSARPDVILSLHLFTAPGALALSRTLRRPWIQWVHAMEFPQKPALARLAVNGADAIVAVSRYSRSLALDAGADASQVRIVPPGVDLPHDNGRAARLDRPTIVTVSRLAERYKGHDTLARAMPLVSARVPGAQWVVLGDGPLRGALEALARSCGADARFLGAVSDAERDGWLDRAHVFCMPSRLPAGGFAGEGFGIVFLEAGLHGLPVVAGDVGGARDAVRQGETGLLVDPTDHVALADALTRLLLEPERAVRMGAAGARWARAHAWPAICARVRAVVDEVAA